MNKQHKRVVSSYMGQGPGVGGGYNNKVASTGSSSRPKPIKKPAITPDKIRQQPALQNFVNPSIKPTGFEKGGFTKIAINSGSGLKSGNSSILGKEKLNPSAISYPKGDAQQNPVIRSYVGSKPSTSPVPTNSNVVTNQHDTSVVLSSYKDSYSIKKENSKVFGGNNKGRPPINNLINIPKPATSSTGNHFQGNNYFGKKAINSARGERENIGYAKLSHSNNSRTEKMKENLDTTRISNNNTSFLDVSHDGGKSDTKKDISTNLRNYKNFLKNNINVDKLMTSNAPSKSPVPVRGNGKGIPKSNSDLNKTFDNSNSKKLDDTSFIQKENSFIASTNRKHGGASSLSKESSFKIPKQNSMNKNSKPFNIFQQKERDKSAGATTASVGNNGPQGLSGGGSFHQKKSPIISSGSAPKNYLSITNNNYTIINTSLNNSININDPAERSFISQIPTKFNFNATGTGTRNNNPNTERTEASNNRSQSNNYNYSLNNMSHVSTHNENDMETSFGRHSNTHDENESFSVNPNYTNSNTSTKQQEGFNKYKRVKKVDVGKEEKTNNMTFNNESFNARGVGDCLANSASPDANLDNITINANTAASQQKSKANDFKMTATSPLLLKKDLNLNHKTKDLSIDKFLNNANVIGGTNHTQGDNFNHNQKQKTSNMPSTFHAGTTNNYTANTVLGQGQSNQTQQQSPLQNMNYNGYSFSKTVFNNEKIGDKKSSNKDAIYSNFGGSMVVTKKIKQVYDLSKMGFQGYGVKKVNQDNFSIHKNFGGNVNSTFFAVFDGHGQYGHHVSKFLRDNLPHNLDKEISSLQDQSQFQNTIEEVFLITNNDLNTSGIETHLSGSTCVSVIYTPEKLVVANLGDSRAILGRCVNGEWQSQDLSNDHKPCSRNEYVRILRHNGRVEAFKDDDGNYSGPKRVWLQNEDTPGLAMSRAFGDKCAASVGVISVPEITEYTFTKDDKFIVLGSDGVYEFIKSEEVVTIIKDFYLSNNIKGACEYIIKESSTRWINEEEVIDDITIILIFLD